MKKNLIFIAVFLMIFLGILFFAEGSLAATYYIDFDGGSDTANGTSISTPWKHSPGDSAATGVPGAANLTAGNTYCFKGGVIYQGSITIDGDGTSNDNRITLDGECAGWGTGKAETTHSRAFNPSWTNYSGSIYYATLPDNVSAMTPWFENGAMLQVAQDPNPPSVFQWSDINTYTSVPLSSVSKVGTTGYIVDSANLNQSDANYWNGAWVSVWIVPNVILRAAITSFDPNTDKIGFEIGSANFYSDRATKYARLNHISGIDRAGEYAIDLSANRIYLWAYAGGVPANIRYVSTSEGRIFNLAARDYITIQNFTMHSFRYGAVYNSGTAIGFVFSGNTVHDGGETTSQKAVMYVGSLQDAVITGNTFYNARGVRGIAFVGGSNITTSNNTFYAIDGTGVLYMGIAAGLIHGNLVYGLLDTHGNGISIYEYSSNVVVSNNIVRAGSYLGITWQKSTNLTFVNNVIDGEGIGWLTQGGTTTIVGGYFRFIHNSLIGTPYGNTLQGYNTFDTVVVRNNIFSGGDLDTWTGMDHNCWFRNTHTADGDVMEPGGENAAFVNYAGQDYRLKSTTTCKDAGANLSAYITTDIVGVTRPQGSGWDMGAYEYVGVSTDTTPPSPPTNVVVS